MSRHYERPPLFYPLAETRSKTEYHSSPEVQGGPAQQPKEVQRSSLMARDAEDVMIWQPFGRGGLSQIICTHGHAHLNSYATVYAKHKTRSKSCETISFPQRRYGKCPRRCDMAVAQSRRPLTAHLSLQAHIIQNIR